MFQSIKLHHRSAALGRSLPVDVFVAVSGHELPQAIELTAFANLAMQTSSGGPGSLQQRGGGPVPEIRIDAQNAANGVNRPDIPKTERRTTLDMQLLQPAFSPDHSR